MTRRLPGDARSYCLRRQGVLTLDVLEDYLEAFQIDDFSSSCSKKRYLENTARRYTTSPSISAVLPCPTHSVLVMPVRHLQHCCWCRECLSGYGAWFNIVGCQVCIDETDFFRGRYSQVCQQKAVEACETPDTTAEVDALLCSSVSMSTSLTNLTCALPPQAQAADSPLAPIPVAPVPTAQAPPPAPLVSQPPRPAAAVPGAGRTELPSAAPREAIAPVPAAGEDLQIGSLADLGQVSGEPGGVSDSGSSSFGRGAIAGVTIAAVLLLICAAALAALLLMRKRRRADHKEKLAVSEMMRGEAQARPPPQLLAASRGPPASPRADAVETWSPPGSPAISTSSALPISDWKAAAVADGTLTQTHASATATGAGAHTIGATTYAETYQYQGSTYGGVDSTGTFIPMHRAMTGDATEIEHLPAERVVVTRVSGDGDEGGFSVRTRTDWSKAGGSITVFAAGLPPDAKPGEILKAQLDWILAKRGGLLLGYLKCATPPACISSCTGCLCLQFNASTAQAWPLC